MSMSMLNLCLKLSFHKFNKKNLIAFLKPVLKLCGLWFNSKIRFSSKDITSIRLEIVK